MDAVIASLPEYWDGFLRTLYLSVISGIIALIVGTLLAAMRVSPVAALRGFSMFYVEVARNTPLTIIFFFAAIVPVSCSAVFWCGVSPGRARRRTTSK